MGLFSSKDTPKNTELTKLLQGGKEDVNLAMRSIYKKNYPVLRAFIHKNGGTEEEVKDILQEVLLKFVEKFRDQLLNDIKNPYGYVFNACKNQWLNSRRGANRFSEIGDKIVEERPGVDLNAQENLEQRDLKQAVHELLGKLGDTCRKLLIWSLGEGIDMKSVAKSLAYQNAQTAMNRKSKCKKQLKELVSGHTAYQKLIDQLLFSE